MIKKSLIAAGVLILAPSLALAHAQVDHSTPAKNAIIQTSPANVSLTMTEGLEGAFSSLSLMDAGGNAVPTGKSALAPNDNRTLILPIATVLPAGMYTVKWQALSKDGHKTQGSWSFSVKP